MQWSLPSVLARMALELDHVFVCCDPGGAEGDLLVEAGLVEGSANRHAGQGTANRRFFFRNAYLELLWVHSRREAHSEPAKRTGLCERWEGRHDGACPFGICWRSGAAGDEPPFPTWDYEPPYLPEGTRIRVAEDTTVKEPMWFFLQHGRRPDSLGEAQREPTEHAVELSELTGVRLTVPSTEHWCGAGRAIVDAGLLLVTPGADFLLELLFNGPRGKRRVDFRPGLPVALEW